jgi:hypothetical protein
MPFCVEYIFIFSVLSHTHCICCSVCCHYSGVVSGMQCRGGYRVSVQWNEGVVTGLLLQFEKWHPWLMGQAETQPGYFTTTANTSSARDGKTMRNPPVLLKVAVPNAMKRVHLLEDGEYGTTDRNSCAAVLAPDDSLSSSGNAVISVRLNSFPCTVAFCPMDNPTCSANNLSILHINRAIASTTSLK